MEDPRMNTPPQMPLATGAPNGMAEYPASSPQGAYPSAPVNTTVNAPLRNNPILMGLFGAILAIMGALVFADSYSSDIFSLMATGREILENGLPYENPFSYEAGMGIIVQQWALCILLYGLYSAGGLELLALWSTFMAVILMVSLYRLIRLIKGDSYGGEIILVITILAFAVCMPTVDMTSGVYSLIAFCWVIFFCERYRRTDKPLWLIPLLPIIVLHTAFHMAVAPFDSVIIACFCIPDLLKPLHDRGKLTMVGFAHASYRLLPLLIALGCSILGLCINPYGINGALYLTLSYGSALHGNLIASMKPLGPINFGMAGYALIIMIFLAALTLGKEGPRSIPLPFALLVLITLIIGFLHAQNLWFPAPFLAALLATGIHGWSWSLTRMKNGPGALAYTAQAVIGALICVVGVMAAVVVMISNVSTIAEIAKADTTAPTALLDTLDDDVAERYGIGFDKDEINIFNPTTIGGYLEWRGYNAYLDSRVELWDSPINGTGEDRYGDYVDLMYEDSTKAARSAFITDNDFDYLLLESDSPLNDILREDQDYSTLIGNNDYTLWRKAPQAG